MEVCGDAHATEAQKSITVCTHTDFSLVQRVKTDQGHALKETSPERKDAMH